MGIQNFITDLATGIKARVVGGGDEVESLAVATRPLKSFVNKQLFFTNDDYGADMNQNGAYGGTALEIHNGIDTVLWTASNIVGNDTTFNSTDQAYAGTHSIKWDNGDVGDIIQIAGAVQDMTDYAGLTMWVYIDKDWKAGDSISVYGWDTTNANMIGTEVDLEDYFDYLSYDEWHKITIPFADMGDIGTSVLLDAIRIEIITAEGKSPKFYLDTIQFEETGTPVEFTIKPTKGSWLYVKGFDIFIAGSLGSTLGDASVPNIPYDTFFGATLTNGIIYRRIQGGEIITASNIQDVSDILSFSNGAMDAMGGTAAQTWVKISVSFTDFVILKPKDEDKMSVTIADDLSGLSKFRISARAKIEIR